MSAARSAVNLPVYVYELSEVLINLFSLITLSGWLTARKQSCGEGAVAWTGQ